MKEKVKILLFKLGIYNTARSIIKKIYYPYKNYRIRSKASIILKKMYKVFEEHTEDYWLDYGTLLGYVREGKIIKGDLDLDFGVFCDKSLADYLKDEDIYLKEQTIVEGIIAAEQYYYEDIGFDVFYYRESKNNTMVTNVWLALDYSIPQKQIYEQQKGELGETIFTKIETKKIKFYNVDFKVPLNSDKYLKEHFGNDYMTPNPNFSHEDEINRKKIDKEFKVIFYE